MLVASLFTGAILMGIGFLLVFLLKLLREHPVKRLHVTGLRKIGNEKELLITSEWILVERETGYLTMRSVLMHRADMKHV